MGVATAVGLLVGGAVLSAVQQRQQEKKQEKAARQAAEAQEAAMQSQLDAQNQMMRDQRKADAAVIDPMQGGGRAIIGADAVSSLTGRGEALRASRTKVSSSVGGLGNGGQGVQV